MASQSSRQLSNRRESSHTSSSAAQGSVAQTPSIEAEAGFTSSRAPEMTSSAHNEGWEAVSASGALGTPLPQESSQTPPREATKTCWICQMDDTEDTEADTEWRSPCPCSLTAHDACLMEWISNEEAPKAGEIAYNHDIKCPQCKADITIDRPRDYLVAVVERIQSILKKAVVPSAVGALICGTYCGLMIYGCTTLSVVFGSEEVVRSIKSLQSLNRSGHDFPRLTGNMAMFLGVPSIAPALVLLRTRLADQAFSLLLPLYFMYPSHRTLSWPPPPALAFATLPYLRSAYNELYRWQFGSLEKKWDLAVQRQPRPGETAEQIAEEANRGNEGDDEVIEINIEFGGFGGGDHQHPEEQMRPQAGGVVLDEAAIVGEDNADDLPPLVDINDNQRPPRANGPGPRNGWEIQQNTSISAVASTVMGALYLPLISSLAGDLLRVSLPRSLIEPRVLVPGGIFGRSRLVVNKGLLTEKWGRTLVGGCLFVVIKDVVILYCKWRKARDFGKRKVRDFVGRRSGDRRVG